MKKKTTIHDIARELQIDSSTVSRALSDSARVRQKTKDLVESTAQRLGYQPNNLASNLRKKKSNSIGVIVPRISRHFFSSVIEGIDDIAYAQGYNLVICQSMDEIERERDLIKTLLANQVDGILISISMETKDVEHLVHLEEKGIPMVLFDRIHAGLNSSKVVIDDYEASFQATEHLIINGAKRIAHFTGPKDVSIYADRLNGYTKALEKHKVHFEKELVLTSRLMEKDGIQCAEDILKLHQIPDGIFVSNDIAAIAAMKFLKAKGFKIPHDIAIVGFSNEPIASVMEPSLTTMDQPGFEIGKQAARILLDQINNPGLKSIRENVTIKSTLIVRESSVK
ncbi:MAG: LacI family transcriptional regulator [Cyclobacteriaceae bacterium]|nr:LacI family transcriptional regulator [Cyclobacteriaceae bacterium]